MIKKFSDFVRENKSEFFLILLILTLGAFLRLWRISEYMTFLGDEGRDALVIMRFLRHGDPILIGPSTSIGNMLLGPLYYWMMITPMFISRLSPVGPAVMVALLGVGTIFLIYRVGKDFFKSSAVGFFASALYAVSPVTIIYFHSSWNPNPMPFFALLSIYSFFKVFVERKYFWIFISLVSLAFALQMHYMGAVLVPILVLFWLVALARKIRDKTDLGPFWRFSLIAFLAFFILMFPILWFDIRHDFINFKAFQSFFTQRETTVNLNFFNAISRVLPNFLDLFVVRFVTGKDWLVGVLLSIGIFLTAILYIARQIKNRFLNWGFFIILVWLAVGIGGISLYKQHVYDHYFGFMNPTIFLLSGLFLGFLYEGTKKIPTFFQFVGKVLALILFAGLIFLNMRESPLKDPPNRQLERTQKIAQFVIQESQDNPFNFALLAKSNYDAAYQYYLELWNYKPKQVDFEQTEQLFVVCEDPVCNPIGHPKSEIARFGFAKIEKAWNFSGVRMYKLIHNPRGIPQKDIPAEIPISL